MGSFYPACQGLSSIFSKCRYSILISNFDVVCYAPTRLIKLAAAAKPCRYSTSPSEEKVADIDNMRKCDKYTILLNPN
jgi:hypothetical protein